MVAGGFLGLLLGGNWLVDGAVALALRLSISPMIIGLTLVGFGTSMPELVTSVQAALIGSAGIAVGNVVGSNIANILLILGVAALIAPMAVDRGTLRRDGMVMLLASVLCVLIVLYGTLGRVAGSILLGGLALYLVLMIRLARTERIEAGQIEAGPIEVGQMPGWRAGLTLAGGLVVTIVAAKFLVQGAVVLAADWGMSETVIGLTVVAVGTSLPELVTSVVAARKGQSDLAIGNVIGSNIFNILGILGITALVQPLVVPQSIMVLDIWVMLGAALALILLAMRRWQIGRLEGGLLVASYTGYVAYLVAGL
jgi:cation:H+ antiporter